MITFAISSIDVTNNKGNHNPPSQILNYVSFLFNRLAGQSDTEFLEYLAVYLRQHHGGMNLTPSELRQHAESLAAIVVGLRQY